MIWPVSDTQPSDVASDAVAEPLSIHMVALYSLSIVP
jgi:hypothetical protein